MRADFLRRATPTPFTAELGLIGCTIRLETNNPAILDCIRGALEKYGPASCAQSDFLWRLVSEPDNGCKGRWPEATGFSAEGLSLISFGQRSFVAIDADAREAVGFIEDSFARDGAQFESLFLSRLTALTAQALGLARAFAGSAAEDRETSPGKQP